MFKYYYEYSVIINIRKYATLPRLRFHPLSYPFLPESLAPFQIQIENALQASIPSLENVWGTILVRVDFRLHNAYFILYQDKE